jgi:lauroyl/myristoyl acyltransferase
MQNLNSFLHLAGYSAYIASILIARLFPLALVFKIGEGFGMLGFYLLHKRRRLAIKNLKLALGVQNSRARRLACQHFANLGANVFCMLKIPSMSDAELGKHVTVEISPDLSMTGHGFVAVLGHMSNWELLARSSGLFPHHRFGAIYQKLANPWVNRHFRNSRSKAGLTLFDRGEEFWDAVAFLESGGILGVIADQYAGVSGTWMPFFGRLTSTSTLPAALAGRVGVKLVPVTITTTGQAKWHVAIGNPLPMAPTPEVATAKINRELERQISACPADWLWSHNRWKTPKFAFLLAGSKRRVFYPPDFDKSASIPYRILIRSVDEMEESVLSLPAVRAIKHGRPDAQVTMLCKESLAEYWRSIPEVDAVISFENCAPVFRVAKKIQTAGWFDVGILFPASPRGAWEMIMAGVPHRLGPPARPFLNTWANAPGKQEAPMSGAERYLRIADAAGAARP